MPAGMSTIRLSWEVFSTFFGLTTSLTLSDESWMIKLISSSDDNGSVSFAMNSYE